MSGISVLWARKIIVIGCPGSGKSCFARALHRHTNLPLHYLDCIYWQENWVGLPRDEFIRKQEAIMAAPGWIIDGNYGSTLELRFARADAAFFLDLPEAVCIRSEAQRRGLPREDLPAYLTEEEDPEFVAYIRTFRQVQRPGILALAERYPNVSMITFHTREEVNRYLET